MRSMDHSLISHREWVGHSRHLTSYAIGIRSQGGGGWETLAVSGCTPTRPSQGRGSEPPLLDRAVPFVKSPKILTYPK